MTKTIEKYIDFGTATDKVADRSLPSIFTTPSNYTPTQIASEGIDKVSAHLKGIDTKLGQLSGSSFIDEWLNGTGATILFYVTEPFDETTVLEVFVNGVKLEEGNGWVRNHLAGTVSILDDNDSAYAVEDGSRLLVRVHSATPYIDEWFDGTLTSLSPTNSFGDATKMDVYINGILGEEDVIDGEWFRTSSNQKVHLKDYAGDVNTRILVRMFT